MSLSGATRHLSRPWGMSIRTIRRWIVLSGVLVAAIFLVVGGMVLLRLAQGVALPVALLPLAPVVLLLGVGSYSARFLRWHLLVSRITSPLSWLASARIYMVGFALGFTPGRIGELVKFTLLREQTGKSEVETVAVFPIERLTEAAAFLGLALTGAWAAHSSVARLSLEAKLALVALPALALLPMAFAVMGRRHHPRARSSLDVVVRGALRITGIRAITGALACAFLARAFDLMLFWTAARAAGLPMTVGEAALAWGTAGLLGGLSLLPAGVGAVESALIASAVSFGGDPAMAVSVTLLSRVATLWMWMIPGFMLALRGLADSQGVLLDIPVDGRDGGLR